MWRNARPWILLFSLALNAAFAGVWLSGKTSALAGGPARARQTPPASPAQVWCPLHRNLAVSPQQWKAIEPGLAKFCTASRKVCDQAAALRLELIAMLEDGQTSAAAVEAKQEEIVSCQRKVQDLSIALLLEEKRHLTSAQQKQLFDAIRRSAQCQSSGPFRGFGGGAAPAGQSCDPACTPPAPKKERRDVLP